MQETLCAKIESYDEKNNQHQVQTLSTRYDPRVPAPQGFVAEMTQRMLLLWRASNLEKVEQHLLSLITSLACGWEYCNSCL
jgi:hypothetical protein